MDILSSSNQAGGVLSKAVVPEKPRVMACSEGDSQSSDQDESGRDAGASKLPSKKRKPVRAARPAAKAAKKPRKLSGSAKKKGTSNYLLFPILPLDIMWVLGSFLSWIIFLLPIHHLHLFNFSQIKIFSV